MDACEPRPVPTRITLTTQGVFGWKCFMDGWVCYVQWSWCRCHFHDTVSHHRCLLALSLSVFEFFALTFSHTFIYFIFYCILFTLLVHFATIFIWYYVFTENKTPTLPVNAALSFTSRPRHSAWEWHQCEFAALLLRNTHAHSEIECERNHPKAYTNWISSNRQKCENAVIKTTKGFNENIHIFAHFICT